MSISFILDAVTVAVAILFVIFGYRRGFIKSIVRLFGLAISFVASVLISGPVAQMLYTNVFQSRAQEFAVKHVQEATASASGSLGAQIESVVASFPESMRGLMSVYGVESSDFAGAAQTSDALVQTIMDKIITPVCVGILQLIVFLVLFVVMMIVVRLIGKLINRLFASLPVIKQINGLLGAVLGFAEGVLVLFVIGFGVQLYMTFTGDQSVVTTADIEKTTVFGWLMSLNPIF